jgi:hypothetical protein
MREGKDRMTLFQSFLLFGDMLTELAQQMTPPNESLVTQ